jgi:[NiFe] hydrogenase assembly HybE family chaperone
MPEADKSAEISDRLAAAFAKIHAERMDGVPILNPRLKVEVIETRAWNGRWLSVLVTPWFINLMLLAQTEEETQAWQNLELGAKVLHSFPAGRFDFIVGEETGLGRYQMCSLFSPVLEFEDQEAARETARAALEAIFDASLDEEPTKESEVAEAEGKAADTGLSASDISRRGLLTGKLVAPEKGVV